LNPITTTPFLSIEIGDCNVIFLKAAVTAWANSLAVWKADAEEACDAAAGNSVACGSDSCDDHILRSPHANANPLIGVGWSKGRYHCKYDDKYPTKLSLAEQCATVSR